MMAKIFVLVLFTGVTAIGCLFSPVRASGTEVDAQLVLAVDVSRSMTSRELEIQRRGYAEALASKEVVGAIKGGLLGQIAILYVEWAGNNAHRVIVDWTIVGNASQAREFSRKLTTQFDSSLRRTSISGALDYASHQFVINGFISNRKIIDVSGDGPNNQGRPVLEARAQALAKGITINGLPLMTSEGIGGQFHLDNLDEYYRNCVIGGPGSFVLPVTNWEQFPTAVRHKIVLELAQFPSIAASNFIPVARYEDDCLIGEKIWQERRLYWDDL